MTTNTLRKESSQVPIWGLGSLNGRASCFTIADRDNRKHGPNKSFPDRYREVLQYLPLVRAIALTLYAKLEGSPSFEKMITAGVFGLFEATGEFNPSGEIPFMSYAKSRIKGAMLAHLLCGSRPVVSAESKKEGK